MHIMRTYGGVREGEGRRQKKIDQVVSGWM
jgi:hypothetical protein